MSQPSHSRGSFRTLSRICLLNQFLRMAPPNFRLTEIPKRLTERSLDKNTICRNWLLLRRPCSKTFWNWPGLRSRCFLENPCFDSLGFPFMLQQPVGFRSVIDLWGILVTFWSRQSYGISRLRPLARRRFKTSRPALLLIRSRNPWALARFRLLGLKVGCIK
jgi:hypothetical protein